MNPHLPADLFSACLTTPIKTALLWCGVCVCVCGGGGGGGSGKNNFNLGLIPKLHLVVSYWHGSRTNMYLQGMVQHEI